MPQAALSFDSGSPCRVGAFAVYVEATLVLNRTNYTIPSSLTVHYYHEDDLSFYRVPTVGGDLLYVGDNNSDQTYYRGWVGLSEEQMATVDAHGGMRLELFAAAATYPGGTPQNYFTGKVSVAACDTPLTVNDATPSDGTIGWWTDKNGPVEVRTGRWAMCVHYKTDPCKMRRDDGTAISYANPSTTDTKSEAFAFAQSHSPPHECDGYRNCFVFDQTEGSVDYRGQDTTNESPTDKSGIRTVTL